MKRGGSAADAVLTTALAQVALNVGSTISYAGILTAVYYDASSGKVYSLNAGWNTPKKEINRLPFRLRHSFRQDCSVPGFFAGVQALHERFGKRPFPELFEPAIWLADHGFPLPPAIDGWRHLQSASIERRGETRKIFQNQAGRYIEEGDTFRQPKLAKTLRQVATNGASYIYRGDWARRFVGAVQEEGGRITLDDMTAYKAVWTEPTSTMYRGFEVKSLGMPSIGGLQTLSALQLAEFSLVKSGDDYHKSPMHFTA